MLNQESFQMSYCKIWCLNIIQTVFKQVQISGYEVKKLILIQRLNMIIIITTLVDIFTCLQQKNNSILIILLIF